MNNIKKIFRNLIMMLGAIFIFMVPSFATITVTSVTGTTSGYPPTFEEAAGVIPITVTSKVPSNSPVRFGVDNNYNSYGSESTFALHNYWEKKNGGDWNFVSNGTLFSEGTYRYVTMVFVDGTELNETARIDMTDDFTAIINGEEWTSGNTEYKLGKRGGRLIYSPEYLVRNLPKYTITLNANGGNAIAKTTYRDYEDTLFSSLNIPNPTHSSSCMSFAGWYDDSVGGNAINVATYTLQEDITLYAHWNASHTLSKTNANAATCTATGNIDYWTCSVCSKIFSDAGGTTEITAGDTVVAMLPHTIGYVAASASTCTQTGNIAHYKCSVCNKLFDDGVGTNELSIGEVTTPLASHTLNLVAANASTCTATGNIAHYKCSVCNKLFDDDNASNELTIEQVTVAMASHTLNKTDAVAETCMVPGNINYWTCSVCGHIFSDAGATDQITAEETVIPKHAHNLSKTNAVAATCIATGNIDYWTCSECHNYFSDAGGVTQITAEQRITPMIAHTLNKTDAVAETCTANGNINYWTCSACGRIFSDSTAETQITAEETVIPKHAHSLIKTNAVSATCTATGNIDYWTCSECHNYFSDAGGVTQITAEQRITPMVAHTLNKTNANAATCTATGNINYWTCSACGHIFSDSTAETQITAEQTVTPMIAHTLDKTDAVAETCMANGNIDYWTCSVCGHIFSNSTATNQITAEDTVIPKHAHNLTKTNAVSATCTATGNIDYWTCSECHNYFSDAGGVTQITAEQRITPMVAHTLNKTNANAATCTATGNINYWTCSACGHIFSDSTAETQITAEQTVTPMIAHTLDKTDAVAETCMANGNIDYWTCSVCGHIFSNSTATNQITAEDTVIPKHAHNLTKTNAVSATCTATGNIDYWTCSECHNYFSDENGNTQITAEQRITPMVAHTLDKTDAVAETCMAPGNIDYWTCSVCGHIFSNSTATNQITAEQTVVPKHAHNLTKTDAVAETCTANGNINYWTCSECHNYFSNAEGTTQITADDTVIPKHAHNLTKTNAVAETCTANGNIDYWTCSECHNYFSNAEGTTQITAEATVVPKHAHNLSKTNAVAATCTATGNIDYWTCSECHNYFSDANGNTQITAEQRITPMIAHTLDKTDAVAETCMAPGNIDYWTCSVCGHIFSNSTATNQITADETVIPKHAHNLSKTDAVAETCTANGNIDYWTCSECHNYFSNAEGTTQITADDTVVSKHAHTLSKTNAVSATCTATGNIDYWTCSECHNYFSDENGNTQITAEQRITPMVAHTLDKTDAVAETCMAPGNIDYWTCSVCGHIFSNSTATNQITADDTVVPKHAHNLSKTDAVSATCTATGNIDYWTCSECHNYFSDANGNTQITAEQRITPIVAHTLSKTDEVAETCTANGNIDYWTCSVCHKFFSDEGITQIDEEETVIPKHAHTLSKTDAVESTCTATGNIDYWTCSECHNYFSDANGNTQITAEQRITAMKAHTLVKTNAVSATCTEQGNIDYWTCSVCTHIFSDEGGNTQITAEQTVTAMIAHTLVKTNANAATCTATGNIDYWTCSVCSHIFSDANGNTQITAEQTVTAMVAHTLNKTNAVAETCTANGNIDYWICSVCGHIFSDSTAETQITADDTVIPKHAHTLSKTDAVAATCTATGNIDYWTCSECHNYFSDANGNTQITAEQRITAMKAHTLVKTNAVSATCTEQGNIDYWTCSVCTHIFSDEGGNTQITAEQTVTAMIAHTLVKTNANAATCTATGNIDYWTCSVCSHIFSDANGNTQITAEQTVTAMVAHTLNKTNAVAETCTANGNIDYWICSVCGHIFSDSTAETQITADDTVIPKHAHTLSKTDAVAATCTATGNIDYWTCSECHNYFSDANGNIQITPEQRITPMIAHTLNKTDAVAETCTAYGNINYWTCSVCGHIFSDANGNTQITSEETVVPKHAHNLTKTNAVAETCTANGNINYWTCSECGNYFSDANGNTQITAEETVVPKHAHTLNKTNAVAETCTANGNIDYWTCSECGNYFSNAEGTTQITEEQTVVAKHAHTLAKTNAVAATCTAEGNIDYWTCSECENYFSDANGNTQITAEQRITAMIAHTLVKTNAVAATCTAEGNTDYWTCSVCGHIFSDSTGETQITAEQTVTAMIAHTIIPVEAAESTCTEQGHIAHYKCTACNKVFTDEQGENETTVDAVTLDLVPHTIVYVEAVPATTTATGNKEHYKCTVCGKLFSDEEGTNEVTLASVTIKKKTSGGGGGGSSTPTTYRISTKVINEGGSISPENPKAEKGDTIKFTITVNDGYEIMDVLVDDVSVGSVETYTLSNIKDAHSINVKFAKIPEEVDNPDEGNNNSEGENNQEGNNQEGENNSEGENNQEENNQEGSNQEENNQEEGNNTGNGSGSSKPTVTDFVDLSEDAWYYKPIKHVVEKGLFSGVTKTEFAPKQNLTRAMLVTVLYKYDEAKDTNLADFLDVSKTAYFSAPIAWANKNGIVSGIGSNMFAPKTDITRQDLVTILYKYARFKDKNVEISEDEVDLSNYEDAETIAEYAKPAVRWAVKNGILSGRTPTTIVPKGTATRAEAAALMQRIDKIFK